MPDTTAKTGNDRSVPSFMLICKRCGHTKKDHETEPVSCFTAHHRHRTLSQYECSFDSCLARGGFIEQA